MKFVHLEDCPENLKRIVAYLVNILREVTKVHLNINRKQTQPTSENVRLTQELEQFKVEVVARTSNPLFNTRNPNTSLPKN